MGFAFIPLYVRCLGVESYGLIGLFALVQAWLVLLDFGMTPTLNREMARYTAGHKDIQAIHDLLRSLELVVVALGAVIAIGLWLSAGWLAENWIQTVALPSSLVAEALSIMALVVALRFGEGLYHGALYGLQLQAWYSGASALIATIRGLGAVALLAFGSPTISAFFFWQLLVSLTSLLLYRWKVHAYLGAPTQSAQFSSKALVRIWRFAGGMTGIAMLSVLLTQVDKVMLSKMITLEAFAYYSLAATLAAALSMLVIPVDNAVYPQMVKLVELEAQSALIDLYHKSAQLVSILTVPVMLLCVFMSEGILYMWTGDHKLAASASPLLSVLALGTFLNCLMHIPYQLQIANGLTKIAIWVNGFALLFFIPALWWSIPKFGPIAAACAWVGLNTMYVLVVIHLTHRTLLQKEKLRWYIDDVLLPVAAGSAAFLLVQLMQPSTGDGRLHWLVFLAVAGMVTALAAAGAAPHGRAFLRRGFF